MLTPLVIAVGSNITAAAMNLYMSRQSRKRWHEANNIVMDNLANISVPIATPGRRSKYEIPADTSYWPFTANPLGENVQVTSKDFMVDPCFARTLKSVTYEADDVVGWHQCHYGRLNPIFKLPKNSMGWDYILFDLDAITEPTLFTSLTMPPMTVGPSSWPDDPSRWERFMRVLDANVTDLVRKILGKFSKNK